MKDKEGRATNRDRQRTEDMMVGALEVSDTEFPPLSGYLIER